MIGIQKGLCTGSYRLIELKELYYFAESSDLYAPGVLKLQNAFFPCQQEVT